jgi:hypothetical protein
MSGPIFSPPGPWANYHSTIVHMGDQVRARLARTVAPAPDWTWADALARTVDVRRLLASQIMKMRPLISLGAGWSLSGLLDARTAAGMGILLETGSLAGALQWPNDEPGGQPLVLVGGGSTIRQVCDWLEPRGMMLRSAGSHDGATLAGAVGTGTHGAWLGEGGAGGQIAALLMVVSDDDPVWLTPAAGPAPLSRPPSLPVNIRHIADDAMFRNARTHLGALGVVVAALIRPQPLRYFQLFREENILPPRWPDVMQGIDLAIWGQQLFGTAVPFAYFEVDFDPHNLENTLLTGLLPLNEAPLLPPDPLAVPGVLDALALASLQQGILPSAYASYVALLRQAGQVGPDTTTLPPGTLGGIVQRHERFVPQLYAGALAFERKQLPTVMQEVARAAAGLPPHFVCALRSVAGQGGSLDFCGWEDTLVLNVDGYGALTDPSSAAATMMDRTCALLVSKAIPHRLHWGKQGPFGAARIKNDYGTGIHAWQSLRTLLGVDPRFNLPWLASLGLA